MKPATKQQKKLSTLEVLKQMEAILQKTLDKFEKEDFKLLTKLNNQLKSNYSDKSK